MSAPIVHAQPSSQRGRVRLVSKGAPFEHGKLNVEWARSSTEPDVNGAAHFVNDKEKLHLYRSAGGMWSIAPDVDAGIAFAIARTTALHPNTIKAGEWREWRTWNSEERKQAAAASPPPAASRRAHARSLVVSAPPCCRRRATRTH